MTKDQIERSILLKKEELVEVNKCLEAAYSKQAKASEAGDGPAYASCNGVISYYTNKTFYLKEDIDKLQMMLDSLA